MGENIIRIATRKSPLALWQAEHVAAQLHDAHPGIKTELVRMQTQGDRILDAPLAKVGGKGLFVKELEQGMLAGDADIAVHSMKDVPVEFPEGLHLAAILVREDPCDALVSNQFSSLKDLPENVIIGTSSLRRQCQIKEKFPEAEIISLRGNVNTRLAKLDRGDYDVIILASAGLKRLGMAGRISEILTVTDSLPAIGQGAIGIECRTNDRYINDILSSLNDRVSSLRVTTERAMNARLQGGCQVPIAGFAELQKNRIYLRGLVGSPDGRQIIRAESEGDLDQAEEIGFMVADELLAKGADKILQDIYN